MTAIAQANAMYQEHIHNRSFLGDVLLYLKHGYVVNYPDLFAMGRPVRSQKSEVGSQKSEAEWRRKILDPATVFVQPDAWYIAMVVGDLKRLVALLPYALPWICFERKFVPCLKFYRTEDLARRAQRSNADGSGSAIRIPNSEFKS